MARFYGVVVTLNLELGWHGIHFFHLFIVEALEFLPVVPKIADGIRMSKEEHTLLWFNCNWNKFILVTLVRLCLF